jgi:hypothetical protein
MPRARNEQLMNKTGSPLRTQRARSEQLMNKTCFDGSPPRTQRARREQLMNKTTDEIQSIVEQVVEAPSDQRPDRANGPWVMSGLPQFLCALRFFAVPILHRLHAHCVEPLDQVVGRDVMVDAQTVIGRFKTSHLWALFRASKPATPFGLLRY